MEDNTVSLYKYAIGYAIQLADFPCQQWARSRAHDATSNLDRIHSWGL
jgi:hypothetical protein